MRNMEENFNDWGIDALTGTEIMRLTGITPTDFVDPVRYQRFRDVIQHLKGIPDKEFYITKITLGKNVDKLDHLWSYVELEKRKAFKLDEAKRVDDEVSTFIRFANEKNIQKLDDLGGYVEASKKREVINNDIHALEEQMSYYER